MDELVARLSEKVDGRYFGKYRGIVADNRDPLHLGRLRVKVPSLLGDAETAWALPCLPFGGLASHGFFAVPEKDAQVWVEFEEGDLDHPIWTGTFWRDEGDVPAGARLTPPTTRLLETPAGHRLRFDDEEGREQVVLAHCSGAELAIDEDGSVSLAARGGCRVLLDAEVSEVLVEDGNRNRVLLSASGVTVEDAAGNAIELTASGAKVKALRVVLEAMQVGLGAEAGEPALKGTSFLTAFSSHVHLSAPPGAPTTPPVPLPTLASALSTCVLVK